MILRKTSLAFFLSACLSISQFAYAEEDGMGAVDYKDSSEASTSNSVSHESVSHEAIQERADEQPAERPPNRNGPPVVGRKAAQKYMGRSPERRNPSSVAGGEAHYLAIHIGTFLGDDSYKWGTDHESNVGKFNAGLTYRLGEWANAADFAFRADYSSYNLSSGTANKLALLPVIIFPDATSHFPLYFGGGAGPGFYLKQISGQSAISLDYQLFLGARFFNLLQSTGLFIEAGVKNHLHLLSNGQYNGSFLAFGALFTF